MAEKEKNESKPKVKISDILEMVYSLEKRVANLEKDAGLNDYGVTPHDYFSAEITEPDIEGKKPIHLRPKLKQGE